MEQKLTDEQRKALAKARTEWPAEFRIHPEYSAAMFLAGAEYQRTLDAGKPRCIGYPDCDGLACSYAALCEMSAC